MAAIEKRGARIVVLHRHGSLGADDSLYWEHSRPHASVKLEASGLWPGMVEDSLSSGSHCLVEALRCLDAEVLGEEPPAVLDEWSIGFMLQVAPFVPPSL